MYNKPNFPNHCNGCYYVVGIPRPRGPAGTPGILNYADFYALMPGDNAATIAPGGDVSFPQEWYIYCQT